MMSLSWLDQRLLITVVTNDCCAAPPFMLLLDLLTIGKLMFLLQALMCVELLRQQRSRLMLRNQLLLCAMKGKETTCLHNLQGKSRISPRRKPKTKTSLQSLLGLAFLSCPLCSWLWQSCQVTSRALEVLGSNFRVHNQCKSRGQQYAASLFSVVGPNASHNATSVSWPSVCWVGCSSMCHDNVCHGVARCVHMLRACFGILCVLAMFCKHCLNFNAAGWGFIRSVWCAARDAQTLTCFMLSVNLAKSLYVVVLNVMDGVHKHTN